MRIRRGRKWRTGGKSKVTSSRLRLLELFSSHCSQSLDLVDAARNESSSDECSGWASGLKTERISNSSSQFGSQVDGQRRSSSRTNHSMLSLSLARRDARSDRADAGRVRRLVDEKIDQNLRRFELNRISVIGFDKQSSGCWDRWKSHPPESSGSVTTFPACCNVVQTSCWSRLGEFASRLSERLDLFPFVRE